MGVDGMRTAEILVVGSLLFGLGIRSARQSAGRGGGGEYEYEYEYEHVMTRIHNPRAHFLHSPFTVHRSPCSWPYPYPYPDTLHYSSLVTRIRIRIRRGWSRGRKCGPLALRIQSRVPSRDNVICKRQRAGPGGGGGGKENNARQGKGSNFELGPSVLCSAFSFRRSLSFFWIWTWESGHLQIWESGICGGTIPAKLSSSQLSSDRKWIEGDRIPNAAHPPAFPPFPAGGQAGGKWKMRNEK